MYFFMNCVYFIYCWYYYLYEKKKPFIKLDQLGYFLLQMNQQIIFGPHNRSIGSITTRAVERIPRKLGLICNTGPYRITAEIVKDGSSVGLGYGITSLVKCQRVIVTLAVAVTRIVLQN